MDTSLFIQHILLRAYKVLATLLGHLNSDVERQVSVILDLQYN